jgi:hypothetical protein
VSSLWIGHRLVLVDDLERARSPLAPGRGDLLFANQISQSGEPGIRPLLAAVARTRIQIGAALRAQALAIVRTERLHGQRQMKLLDDQFAQIDPIVGIERRRQIILVDLPLAFACVLKARHVAKIELCRDRQREGLEAPAACQLQHDHDAPGHSIAARFLRVNVERQHDGRHHSKRIVANPLKEGRFVALFDVRVRVLQRAKLQAEWHDPRVWQQFGSRQNTTL